TGQVPVHQGHRVLGVEVRAAAQPLDDGGGARVAAVVGEQAGDGLDPHVQPLDGGAGQLDPPVEVEEVALGRVVGDRDDDLVEDVAGTADDVDVPEGDRVEGAGADGQPRRPSRGSLGHGAHGSGRRGAVAGG